MILSMQAKKLYKEFPEIPENNIRNIDTRIKQKINTMDNGNIHMLVSQFIQREIYNSLSKKSSLNEKKIKKKANKLATIYIENSNAFSLQESWYALLAFFIAIANMIQRVINFDTEKNDILSFIIYLGTMLIWLLIVKSKKMMSKNAKSFVDVFNRASSSMAVISLTFFYLVILSTDCNIIWIVTIGLFVIITVGLSIYGYVNLRRFEKNN